MSATPSSDRDAFGLCGTVLGDKYRVLEVVGEGGFGVVYRGVHAGFDAPIALKCLKVPPHFDRRAEQALVEGLRAEGRLLLRLSQRTSGIVQALDVGSFETARGARVPYLVLEWLEGRSLADELRLRRASGLGGMGLGEALGVLEPAARALAVAHGEQIAHRDVKPENLFLVETAGGRTLKVLDFGIAKVLAEAATPETAATSGGAPTFTPPYGAPEQFDRRRGASGPWTDVFALALVFVELVAGRRALVGETLIDFLRASCDEDTRPTLRACGVAAPDAVERVLARALAVDPSARYATAGAFWDALAAAVGSLDDATVSRAGKPPATSSPGADAGVSTAEFASAVGIAVDDGASPRVESAAAHARTAVAPAPLDSAAAATRAPTTRAGVVVEEPRPLRRRRRGPLVAAGAVFAALAVGLVVYFARGQREPDATLPSASGTESAPSASAAPVSDIPEAAALYGEALEAWRGGSPEAAVRTMERAAALDRDLGAAQLRLALWKFGRRPVDARDHYDLALRHAASLGPKEAALLAAVEPMLREPSDFEALDARLGQLCEAHPGDGELWGYLAAARLKRLRFDEALAAVEPALAADPGNVGAWVLKAESLSMKGDSAGQLAAYEACLARVPRAVECLNKLIGVRSMLGDCAGMRDGARRLLAMNPRSATTQRQLALSLFAAGEPHDAVLQALGQSWELRAETERKAVELSDRAALGALEGDLAGATSLVADWLAAVAGRPDQSAHATPAFELADLFTEMGEPEKAAAAAADFQRHMGAWTDPPEGDWTLTALGYQLRAGKVTRAAFAEARAAWLERVRAKWRTAGKRLDVDADWSLWSAAYGWLVDGEAEAKEALAALPRATSAAVSTGRWTSVDLFAGKSYALAGDFAAALPHLRRVARSCATLAEPLTSTRAGLWLGVALEGSGDREGARAAYEAVLRRWGAAKPRSLTAEQAKARLAALPAR